MIANWKDEFAPHILARGKKYFEEGRVGRIQSDRKTFIAPVEGTEHYEVEISLGEDHIEEMLCNCPYAEEDNCKHMAAVLFALECDDVSIEDLPPAKRPPIVSHIPIETPWLEAIDNLPEEVVRKELLKRADRDERLKERLAVLYLGKLPEGQIQNWKADLQEIAGEYANRRGQIRDDGAWDFLYDLGNFLDAKLPLLFEVGAVMDAFHLIWIVLETALEWEVDDLEEGAYDLFEDCENALRTLWAMATEEQREQMWQWYQEHRNEDWPGDVDNIDRIFRSLAQPDAPNVEKRIIKYLGRTPCFLHEGKWISFPQRGHIYYDFVEELAEYKEAVPVVEEIIKEKLGELYGHFGSCHAIWHHRKLLLMEKYGIEWFSPAELNRDVDFD